MSGQGFPSEEALGCWMCVCVKREREKDWSPTEDEKEGLSFFGASSSPAFALLKAREKPDICNTVKLRHVKIHVLG